MKDGIEKYESFVNSYNYEREHGGINGMTPSEKFMNIKTTNTDTLKQDYKMSAMWYIILSTMCISTTTNNSHSTKICYLILMASMII